MRKTILFLFVILFLSSLFFSEDNFSKFDLNRYKNFKWSYRGATVHRGIFKITTYRPGDGFTPTYQKVCSKRSRGKCVQYRMVYGLMASGRTVFWGAVACDRRFYPFGTLFYFIRTKQTYSCLDVGSKIRGKHLDIFVPKNKVKNVSFNSYEDVLYLLPNK